MIQDWSGNVWRPAVERSRKVNTSKTHNSFCTLSETFQMWSRACFIFAHHGIRAFFVATHERLVHCSIR
jgi:hypothetical protein